MKRVPEGVDESGGDLDSGGPCHLYGGGAPHHKINTRARGHTGKVGQQDELLSCEMQSQTERSIEMPKSVCDEMMVPVHENMPRCDDENMPIFDDEEPVSVAQPQRHDTIVGQSVCDVALAPGREMIMKIKCEETMGVDQLLRDIVRGGQDIVQVGQNVDLQANSFKSSEVKKVSNLFPLFTNKLSRKYDTSRGNLNTLTPSKRKLKIREDSNTMVCSFDTSLADNPQGDIIESPAKRRKCAPEGSVS